MLRWFKRLLTPAFVALAFFTIAIWLIEYFPHHDPHPPLRLA
jgi:hypothetical protein